jgi:hypothetical protein
MFMVFKTSSNDIEIKTRFFFLCEQNHKVWEKLQFWETAYYQEVERQIKLLYKPNRHGVPRPRSPDHRKVGEQWSGSN